MDDELLKKINKKLKIYMNESTFISTKCRNKVLKMLGNEFSVNLPIENFKNIDVEITNRGTIVMRDEEYKSNEEMSSSEVLRKFEIFSSKVDEILKRKEVNYYNMNDKNNILNILILLVMAIIFVPLVIFVVMSFIAGNYINSIWLFVFVSSWLIPGLRDRVKQAIDFIKRKFRK